MWKLNRSLLLICILIVTIFLVYGAGTDTDIGSSLTEPVIKCDTEIIFHEEYLMTKEPELIFIPVNQIIECDSKEIIFSINISGDGACYKINIESYLSWDNAWETVITNETVCIKDTSIIEYKNSILEYEKEKLGCTVYQDYIICDEKEDGNGDGICQSGETCYKYEIKVDYLELTDKTNGDIILDISTKVPPIIQKITIK